MRAGHRLGLGDGQPQRVLARQLAAQRRLVGLGRHDPVGLDADLPQQGEAARGGGREDQRRPGLAHLKR